MAENKNWRARSVRRALTRRQQQKDRAQQHERMADLADQLVPLGRFVQEGVYAKMSSQADAAVLRALVEERTILHSLEASEGAAWAEGVGRAEQATCA